MDKDLILNPEDTVLHHADTTSQPRPVMPPGSYQRWTPCKAAFLES